MAKLISPGISVTIVDEDRWEVMGTYYIISEIAPRDKERWYKVWAGNEAGEWILTQDDNQYYCIGPGGNFNISESLLIIMKLKFPDAAEDIINIDMILTPVRPVSFITFPIKINKTK